MGHLPIGCSADDKTFCIVMAPRMKKAIFKIRSREKLYLRPEDGVLEAHCFRAGLQI